MNLVTGGTGLLGAYTLLYLLKDGDSARATYRSKEKLAFTKRIFEINHAPKDLFEQIDWHKADILDLSALEDAFQGITKVYHCAGIVSFSPSKKAQILQINHQGTANMANIALKYPVEKFCHISSVLSLSKGVKDLVDEKSSKQNEVKSSSYALSKYLGEMEVYRAMAEGLNAIVINPGIIVGQGAENSMIQTMIRLLLKFKSSYYMPGSSSFINAKDLAQVMIILMNHPHIKNENYILTSEHLSFKEVQKTIARFFNISPPKKPAPKIIVKTFSKINALKDFLAPSKNEFLAPKLVDFLFEKTRYDNSKIASAIDFNFSSVTETIVCVYE